MTVYWFEIETLQRRSAGLACRRIKERHMYDVIASAISNIFKEFQIQCKTLGVVIDNATNFGKAFRLVKFFNIFIY